MGSSFSIAALAVAAAVSITIVVFAIAALRSRRRDEPGPIVSVTLTLSAFWSVICLVAAILAAFVVGPVTIPVQEYWPGLLPGVTIDASATVTGGGFTEATVWIDDLSTPTQVLWHAGQALGWLIPAAIAGLIAVACFQLLAGRAFAPMVSRAALITAVVVLVGGIGTQVLSAVGGARAAAEVLRYTSASWEEIPGIDDPLAWWPVPDTGISLDFWPIGAALGFAALAAIFRYGAVLQRDTEGLV